MKKKDFTRAGTFSGKRIGTALCAATFLMCGCGNENETAGTDTDGRVPLQVSAGIQTRAYDDRWNKDDAIGIYMLNGADAEASNKKYTTTDATAGGTFSATVAFVLIDFYNSSLHKKSPCIFAYIIV